MILGYTEVLVDELHINEAIFAQLEPTKRKPDAQIYRTKRVRRSPLHWKEHTDKALKELIREGVLKKAPPRTIFSFIRPGHWVPKNTGGNLLQVYDRPEVIK